MLSSQSTSDESRIDMPVHGAGHRPEVRAAGCVLQLQKDIALFQVSHQQVRKAEEEQEGA